MKASKVLLVIGVFLVGVATGVLVRRPLRETQPPERDTPLLTSTLAADIGSDIAYLYRLRDGRTDVVRSVLEMRVDTDLVMLSERLAVLPADERDPQHLKIIQMHREYREKFPYSNSIPAIAEGVKKAYGLLGDASPPAL